MSGDRMQALAEAARRQLHDHILPFWSGPAIDVERGGWMAWLANDLSPDRTKPKGLIVHARILWAFSAAYKHEPKAEYRAMADRALDFLLSRFWDIEHGGAFWRLDDKGAVLDAVKKTYGQAFCIYALTEYHRAFGAAAALRTACAVFELLENHARDRENGGYFEVCSRDWASVIDEPLSDKDLNEKKSMNSHLHVLEACTSLCRCWNDTRLRERLRELIALFEKHIIDPGNWRLRHFFDAEWRVRSDTYTFGHDIEASWLLCEAAEELRDPNLIGRMRALAVRMAAAVLEHGIDAGGALAYEGRAGRVIDAGRECWPQAEAVVGFLNAFSISGEQRFLLAAERVWRFIEDRLVDRVHGEWFWRILPDGAVDAALPKVSEWKGPYHGTRMCLETMNRVCAWRISEGSNSAAKLPASSM